MDPFTSAALISVGSSVLGNIFNASQQRSANKANMALAEYQYQKNLEQWYRENQYNLPVNQMARLRSAGINPVIAFSNGSISGNVAAQSPKYDRPQLQPYQVDSSQLGNVPMNYVQAKQGEQQIELMKSQVQLNNAKVATENCVALLRELQANKQFYDNQLFEEVQNDLVETIRLNRDLIREEISNTRSTSSLKQMQALEIPIKIKEMEARINNLSADTKGKVLENVRSSLLNELETERSKYYRLQASEEYRKLSSSVDNLIKVGKLYDLGQLIKELQLEQMPIELRIKIVQAIMQGVSAAAKAAQ